MSPITPDIVVCAAVDCLTKQDIPEVQAIIKLVEPLADAHWQEAGGEAALELERQLAALIDLTGTPDVDALAQAGSEAERRGLLATLTAAFLLSLRQQVAAPLSRPRQSAIRAGARQLMLRGAASLGLRLDPAAPSTQAALAAAERDLHLLLRGRLESRIDEAQVLLERFLTNKAARTPRPGRLAPLQTGAVPSLEAWRQSLRTVLGLEGAAWLPQTVDVWAYRWYNIGSFQATQQAPVGAIIVVNNPPAGPDAKTTPFCRSIHGSVLSVSRAKQQVERYTRATLAGDVDGIIAAWPLLSGDQARVGTAGQFRTRFQQLGLPPYHFRCRDVIRVRLVTSL